MSEAMRATLFGMVLGLCKSRGMTPEAVAEMFTPENIRSGYAILSDRPQDMSKDPPFAF